MSNLKPLDIVNECDQEQKNSMQLNLSLESKDVPKEIITSQKEIS